ncbi:MAG TPA: multidrug efflux SMR transporter [Nevskiaceae bacterium]|nr:multidrug efflux SMR transporter [Nevskiaceae bacterium]
MGWLWLLAAGVFEVGFTTCLKLSENFSRWPWTVGFWICAAASFSLLSKAITTIPLGTAYAVWTGIGAFGTALIGIVFFKDPLTFWRLFFLFLLIAAVIGLKLVSSA